MRRESVDESRSVSHYDSGVKTYEWICATVVDVL